MTWEIRTIHQADVRWQLFNSQNGQTIDFCDTTDGKAGVAYQTMLIDLPKWDAYWQQDICNFVPENLESFPQKCCASDKLYSQELAMHRQKISRWQREVPQTGQVPAVCFEDSLFENRLRILQGRHRIAYLRQRQAPVFAAAIPLNLLDEFLRQNLCAHF